MSTAPPTQMLGAGPRPEPSEQPRRRSLGRYLFMPITLGLVLLALYVYVAGQELDSIEARSLNMARLSTAIWQHVQLRSEEHTSELQSRGHLVCRLLLEKKKKTNYSAI